MFFYSTSPRRFSVNELFSFTHIFSFLWRLCTHVWVLWLAVSVVKHEKHAHLKINVSVFVHVESSEDVIAKLLGIPRWEEHLVHIYELGWSQFAVGTVALLGGKNKFVIDLCWKSSVCCFAPRVAGRKALWELNNFKSIIGHYSGIVVLKTILNSISNRLIDWLAGNLVFVLSTSVESFFWE